MVQEWSPPSAPAQPADLIAREPCAHNDPLRQAFFGDLHTHTAFSLDALGRGGFQTPDDAYRFARGEEIGLSPLDAEGQPMRTARLVRPLDFAAVTDHSEWLGEVAVCTDPSSPVYDTPACRGVRPGGADADRAAWQAERGAGRGPGLCGEDGSQCREGLLTAWEATRAAAERYYDRSSDCSFTTFHAWEYTRAPERSKVHRNVILRNEIGPELPISWVDADQPQDLWTRLKARCNDTGTGCEALTIPHNPNLSNGQMFTLDWGGMPIDEQRARAALRAEMEPLVEMMQAKGESECRRGMWGVVGGEDELCDFEKVRYIDGQRPPDCEDGVGAGALRGEGCQSRLDFVRYALIEGLAQEQRLGINPMQFGLIGSTDGHNGAPGDTDEYDYQGQNSNVDSDLEKRLTTPAYAPHRLRNPGGLIGVWAEENSRDSLFDAMRRKETFGTSGVRIQARLFAGWDLPDLCSSNDMIAEAYEAGVPMGSVLPSREGAEAPRFFVTALADPGSSAYREPRCSASRSSRAGSATTACSTRRSTMSPATPATARTCPAAPASVVARALPRSAPSGPIPISIRPVPPSTTRGSWRTRAAAGTPCSASSCPKRNARRRAETPRWRGRSRSGPGPRRSGTGRPINRRAARSAKLAT